ncbi:hypothetical protein NHX12_018190 [Muraenolepis orangiensis]|uniref:Multidrug and toxin extrusion protein n=1 Tax=Muraenolepis orangiensis TaxID=630683 RepID=A0A9Q0IXB9_9TELE|nr:hypothetical protein NHX12_018190 [Muraenolepis orangiensis]
MTAISEITTTTTSYTLNVALEDQKDIEMSPTALVEAKPRRTTTDCRTCPCHRRLRIPTVYKQEMVHILKLAGPVMVSQMMVFLISFVSTIFCGHMGKTELAGVALSIAVINITGISIGTGLASACDTLISQTYGSGNLRRVGVILQRGILILLLACFPCWALLYNTEPILLAVRQNAAVASLSQFYVQIFMPALPAAFMYQLQGRYLQNQGIIWPQVVTGVIGNILNAIINYVFLFILDMGVGGSAVANVISQYSLALSLFIYIKFRGLHTATWGGWSMECLQEWGPFLKLAFPSMLMLCLEWWMFEVGGFLAGIISEVELGAQSIIYELATLAYMFPLGFSVAASVRVGNALGAGNIEQAKLTSKVSVVCAIIVSIFVGGSLGIPKDVVAYIFTMEQDIVQRVSDVMVIYSFFHLCDAIACVTGGIIRGAGKQAVGALCNLVGYYFIGFPIGVSLMFAAGMGIVGLWAGLLLCVIIQAMFFITYLSKLNWKKASNEALVRAGIQVVERKDETENEDGGPDAPQCGVSLEAEETAEAQDTHVACATTVGVVLSGRQLVLRRGLALLFMVSILLVAVFLKKLLVDLLR